MKLQLKKLKKNKPFFKNPRNYKSKIKPKSLSFGMFPIFDWGYSFVTFLFIYFGFSNLLIHISFNTKESLFMDSLIIVMVFAIATNGMT